MKAILTVEGFKRYDGDDNNIIEMRGTMAEWKMSRKFGVVFQLILVSFVCSLRSSNIYAFRHGRGKRLVTNELLYTRDTAQFKVLLRTGAV